jgi:hypothetical protein
VLIDWSAKTDDISLESPALYQTITAALSPLRFIIKPPLLFREMYKEGVPDNKVVSVELAKRAELKKVMKRVMPFVAFVKEKVAEAGMAALDTSLPWDERTVLESNKDYIGQSCRFSYVGYFFAVLRIRIRDTVSF